MGLNRCRRGPTYAPPVPPGRHPGAYRHRYANRFTGDPFRIPISVWCSSVYELEATIASTTLTAPHHIKAHKGRKTLRLPGS
jgi:hypothetical protein